MSAILSSAQALICTVGDIFTSAKLHTREFLLWLFRMERPPIYADLADRVSQELSEMAAVLEERKTSWISLTILFGEHKSAARAVAQTLDAVEERIAQIYASKKKTDRLTPKEEQELGALSSALRGHIGTLHDMSKAFPKQYQKITPQVVKIIENAHHLQLSGGDVAHIAGDLKIAAKEVAETFERLSSEADGIYRQYKDARYLPREATASLEEIRHQVRNRLGIIHQVQEDHPEIYEGMIPQLRAISSLMNEYTGLPRHNDDELLKIGELRTLPLYGRLEAIEGRLETIRWRLDQAMEAVQNMIQRNLATAHLESFVFEPIEVTKEVESMVHEARRLMSYHKNILAGKTFDEGHVARLWSGDGGGITPLNTSVPFLEEQINYRKTDVRQSTAIDNFASSAYSYIADVAQSLFSL